MITAPHRRRTRGCTCSITRRAWRPDGTCATCSQRVLESQIQDVVYDVLIAEPTVLLYRNNVGTTVFPDGSRVKYGVGNPGGADLLGLYRDSAGIGRFLAVETKTVRGRQSAEQRAFERFVTLRGGIYAICRSEADARALLERLRGGEGQHQTIQTTTHQP